MFVFISSMIVRNLYVKRIPVLPAEANPPLVVHADAVLACALSLQGFQVVAIRRPQVVQAAGLMQQQQFPPCRALDLRRQPPGRLIVEQLFGFVAGEAAYHFRQTITLHVIAVNPPSGSRSPHEVEEVAYCLVKGVVDYLRPETTTRLGRHRIGLFWP